MNVSRALENLANSTAPAIVLLAPFIHFLVYHRYDLTAPEVLILLGGVAVVGEILVILADRVSPFFRVLIVATVIMFFFDVQFDYERHGYITLIYFACIAIAWMLRDHVTEIAFAVFLTFIASTLLLDGDRTGVTTENRPDAAPARNESLPPIIHLILDEHIGIEGIPVDIAPGPAVAYELKRFYADNGFALFGGAFSQYSKTYNSIANTFNFTSESQDAYYFPVKTDRYVLEENAWFESLGDAGYQIRVYQSDYLDLCPAKGLAIVSCTTYPGNSIKSIEDLDLPATQKARFIAYSILDRSDSFDFVRDKYNDLRGINGFLAKTIPQWNRGADRVGPLGVRSVFKPCVLF